MMKDAAPTTWEQHRRRMLRETELFIEWGLAHPDEVIGIPAKRVGDGGFPARVGEWFWSVALGSDSDSRIGRWREILLSRPREFLSRRARR